MKCKVGPFIMRHIFTFYSFSCGFCFQIFSNISGTAWGSEYIWLCREFQALSFDDKQSFNHRYNRGEIHKILTAQFFMGHPLDLVHVLELCNKKISLCLIRFCERRRKKSLIFIMLYHCHLLVKKIYIHFFTSVY